MRVSFLLLLAALLAVSFASPPQDEGCRRCDHQGVVDAQAYLQTKLLDLEIDVHQTVEFGK